MKRLPIIFFLIICVFSCNDPEPDNSLDANEYLQENIILPPGSILVDASEIEESNSITISGSSSGGVTMAVSENQQINVQIPFNDPNGTVTHAGISFGSPNGQVWMVPINGAAGNSSGTLDFSMQIPSELCNNLSQICHDIKCYEFAAAKDGSDWVISRSNINQLASLCGDCTEPSCQSLLGDNCGFTGQTGSPSFNLVWDNQNVDLDLYVQDPSGEVIYYANTSSDSNGTLDVDCTCSGSCSSQEENIFWTNGPSGNYKFYVDYFGSCGGSAIANWTIRVFEGNRVIRTQTGSISSGMSNEFTYSR